MKQPNVKIENGAWHRMSGLKITVRTGHDEFRVGKMYTVDQARLLALKLNNACDLIESDNKSLKAIFVRCLNKLKKIQ